MSDKPVVKTERDGHVLIITIDRPEARNAISSAVAAGIEAAIDELEGDDGLRVAVLTGAGTVFCAGADLREIAAGRAAQLSTERGGFAGLVRRKHDKPIIGAVQGDALAGGFEVALGCDLLVCAEGIRMGLPEVKRSLVALAGGLVELPRLIGEKLALELALTGDPTTPERLRDAGLVSRVVPQAEVLEQALGLARRIADNGPLAVRASRRIITEGRDLDTDARWEHSFKLGWPVFASEDAKEGPTAFLEKRAPVWKGR